MVKAEREKNDEFSYIFKIDNKKEVEDLKKRI